MQGHAAIAANLKSLWYDRQHWWIGRQHLMNTFIMDPRAEAGEADVRCFFQIIQHSVEYKTNFVFGIGTRLDHVTHKEGRWKFQSLKVNGWTQLADIPWQGRDHHGEAAAGAGLQSQHQGIAMQVTAAVSRGTGAAPALEPVELEAPRAGEMLVRLVATGICHTDLHEHPGRHAPQPIVLGHEGAGVVEALGAGVRGFVAGDHVILSGSSCGRCPSCLANRPDLL